MWALFIQTNAVLPEGLLSPGAKRQNTKLRSDNFAIILLFFELFFFVNPKCHCICVLS